jgi:hypothetical protein
MDKNIEHYYMLYARDIVTDVLKNFTMFLVGRVLVSGSFTDSAWQKNVIGTLIGFTIYHLTTRQTFDAGLPGVPRPVFDDWNKFGTMLVVSRMIVGGGLFDMTWIFSTLAILTGFTVYQTFVAPRLRGEDVTYMSSLQMVIDDWLKFGTMLVLSRVLTCQSIFNVAWIMDTLGILIGFTVYDLLFSRIVRDTKLSVTLG